MKDSLQRYLSYLETLMRKCYIFISFRNNCHFRVKNSGVRKDYWMDLHPHMSSLKAVINDTNLKGQPSNMTVWELLTKSCTFHEHGLDLRLHCLLHTLKNIFLPKPCHRLDAYPEFWCDSPGLNRSLTSAWFINTFFHEVKETWCWQ